VKIFGYEITIKRIERLHPPDLPSAECFVEAIDWAKSPLFQPEFKCGTRHPTTEEQAENKIWLDNKFKNK
jgi:hypothetical protein